MGAGQPAVFGLPGTGCAGGGQTLGGTALDEGVDTAGPAGDTTAGGGQPVVGAWVEGSIRGGQVAGPGVAGGGHGAGDATGRWGSRAAESATEGGGTQPGGRDGAPSDRSFWSLLVTAASAMPEVSHRQTPTRA